MDIKINTSVTKSFTITPEMTAKAIKSGAAEVLSTPCMVAFMEDASCDAVAQFLPCGYISVGTTVNIKHLRPTPIGRMVRATGTIIKVDGNKVLLEVICQDELGIIGKGTHGRYIVHHESFLASMPKV